MLKSIAAAMFALTLWATSLAVSAQELASPPDSEFREQTIYIPYGKLNSIFEKEGRGVFLPYEKYQSLWEAARKNSNQAKPAAVPMRSVITEIDSQATVQDEVMVVDATIQIDLLVNGWHEIPLNLAQSAIRSATIGGENARLRSDGNGYHLILENTEDAVRQVELKLSYAKAIEQSPGTNSVTFTSPQAPINRWRVQVPEEGVEIDVRPNLALQRLESPVNAEPSTTDDEAASDQTSITEATSQVRAFVGNTPQVAISWAAKSEGASGLSAIVTVRTDQQVQIDEGVIRTSATLNYDIARADVTDLSIRVPLDQNIVNVFDPNLQKWDKTADGEFQTIHLTLFQPTRGSQRVVVELEKFAGGKEMSQPELQTEIDIPVIQAMTAGQDEQEVSVGRQQGVLAVKLAESLRAEILSRSGLTQIEAQQLPDDLKSQTWNYVYRYATVPYGLKLQVERLLPELSSEEFVQTLIESDRLTTLLVADVTIKRDGIFRLEADIPTGYEIVSVVGASGEGAEAFAVDQYQLEPADEDAAVQRLIINLARRALGKYRLRIELTRTLDDPNLAQPTGESSTLQLPIPRIAPESLTVETGRTTILAPESLRVTSADLTGVTPLSQSNDLPSELQVRNAASRVVGSYSYTQSDASISVSVQRRQPFIEARQFLSAEIDSGVVRFTSRLFVNVRYSGIPYLRLDVPENLASEIANESDDIQESPLQPVPDDLPQGYVAWKLEQKGELLGNHEILLTWQQPLGELPIGEPVQIQVPRLIVQGADRFWGQIVAEKSETIEVGVGSDIEGLRPIDPQRDLMLGIVRVSAARAFEFHGDWKLALEATRYELEDIKRTSIDRGLVRMVVTRSNVVSVQAIYRIRTARQRIAVSIPGVDPADTAGQLDSQPLRIDGVATPLEHDGSVFYIPWNGHSADEPGLVELRYTLDQYDGKLEVPNFVEEPAAQQNHLFVFLPENRRLLATGGPWTDLDVTPNIAGTRRDDNVLIAKLCIGCDVSSIAVADFPIDGTRYGFVSLKPEPGTAGQLRLTTIHRLALTTWVLGGMALFAIVMVWFPFVTRLAALAVVVAGMFALAVIEPRMESGLLGANAVEATFLVVIFWMLQCAVVSVPRFFKSLGTLLPTTESNPPQPDQPPSDSAATDAEPSEPVQDTNDSPISAADESTDNDAGKEGESHE